MGLQPRRGGLAHLQGSALTRMLPGPGAAAAGLLRHLSAARRGLPRSPSMAAAGSPDFSRAGSGPSGTGSERQAVTISPFMI